MSEIIFPNFSSPPILDRYSAGYVYWDYGRDKAFIWQGSYWIEFPFYLSGGSGTTQNKFTYQIIGNDMTKLFPISHTLNTKNVNIGIYDNSTGKRIYVGETIVNPNLINIEFNHAPITGKIYNVTIFG